MARAISWMTAPAVLVLAAAAGCGSDSSSSSGGGAGSAAGGGTPVAVSAQNFAFSPNPASIPAGGTLTVTFTNKDTAEHSLTFDDGSQSVDVEGGKSGSFTFTAPSSGSIAFHCKYHSSMHGALTVGAAATTASGSSGGGGYGGY